MMDSSFQHHMDVNSFRLHSAGKRIVLLYPWTNYRTMFLKSYLHRAEEGLLYFRPRGTDLPLEIWLSDLLTEFRHVFPDFGAHLSQVLAEGDPEAIGHTLACEIETITDEPIILFIDDFDRIRIDDLFQRFLAGLIDSLPDRVQIALSSSALPSCPWKQMLTRGDAVILGNYQHRSDILFNTVAKPKPQLEVYGFGEGVVLLNGRPIDNWDGVLPKRLFFYLIDNPMVTRDQIFADFWPHLSVKGATDIFHVTKHKISEIIGRALGNAQDCELTTYTQGYYIPNPQIVRHYDVENFTDAVERAYLTTDMHEVELFLTRALDLYRGPYLVNTQQDWIAHRRAALEQKHVEAAIWLAQIHYERHDDDEALRLLQMARVMRSEREDVRRMLIELHLRAGQRALARLEYERMIADIYKPLDIEMTPEAQVLAQKLGL
jgi:DNA-binding SARP family transcriptional activator